MPFIEQEEAVVKFNKTIIIKQN